VSQGKGSEITLTYSEALFDANGLKGHRDASEGREIVGNQDIFVPDGAPRRQFSPLWFRTYRYLELRIKTAADSLVLEDLTGLFTAYPFEENAQFSSSDKRLKDIWNTGWRTARLCAGETYFDCPYYEQMQYVGDTRIQALISLYVSGDDRLMRKAIQVYDDSRFPMGLTQSRYPSSVEQIIPPYSLFWISMVYDYWMHRDDREFIGSFLPGIQAVLGWYERHIDETGMLGGSQWWNFVDWTDEWPWSEEQRIGGVPPGGQLDGHSSILTLHLAYTLFQASDLLESYGEGSLAGHYRSLAAKLKSSTLARCWDEDRGLIADTPKKRSFSQHANIMAVLVDLFPADKSRALMQTTLTNKELIQATFYFQFYLFEATAKAGLEDLYVDLLQPWHDMLSIGLTTFAERPDPTRSDCHAWSASPNYNLLSTVCGIKPAEPGFGAVRIAPHLGPLNWVEGRMPHPRGEIRVRIERPEDNVLQGTVYLPTGIGGVLVWEGRQIRLKEGQQEFRLDSN